MGTRINLTLWLVLFVLLAGAAAHAGLPEPPDRVGRKPAEIENVGQTEKLGAPIPLDLEFFDSRGRPMKLRQCFDGSLPVLLTLNYSNCPRLCSLQLNGLFEGLGKLDYALGDKYRMTTVSLDPEEPPERAQATKEKYLTAYGRDDAAGGWQCLVGREENIRRLADAVGFAYAVVPDTQPKQYAHAAVTIVCTPDGRVSRYLYGIEYSPKTLRMALLEASEGKIGSTADRVLMFCFTYDPEAGSYTLQAVRLMQAAGLLTLAILGGVLAIFWRREIRRTKGASGPVQS